MVCLGMQRAVAAAAGRRLAAHRPAAAAPYRSDLVAAAWPGVRVPVPVESCEYVSFFKHLCQKVATWLRAAWSRCYNLTSGYRLLSDHMRISI